MDLPVELTLGNFVCAAEARLRQPLQPIVQWSRVGQPTCTIRSNAEFVHCIELIRGASIAESGIFRFFPAAATPITCTPSAATTSTALELPASRNVLELMVNGVMKTITDPSPSVLLVDFLRNTCGLTGTKIGCGEGGCGACTVAVKPMGSSQASVPINSCLRLLCNCDGLEITTVEGLGSEASGFSDVQKAIAEGNGSQCGYCTPGWVVNMSTLLEENSSPTRKEVEQRFDGNICRCTGYRPILEAFKDLACGPEEAEEKVIECRLDLNHCGDMEDIAGGAVKKSGCCKSSKKSTAPKKAAGGGGEGCCGGHGSAIATLHFTDKATGDEYWKPGSLKDLVAVLNVPRPGKTVQLVCANTGMGVAKYYDSSLTGQPAEGNHVSVDVTSVEELREVQAEAGGGLSVGASVTISALISALESHFGASDPCGVYAGVVRHLKRVANVQVRGAGSWGGNVAMAAKHAAFGSDVALVLAGLGATLDVAAGERMSVEAYLASGGTSVLVRAHFPAVAGKSQVWYSDKTAQRHVNSHAIVNAAVLLTLNGGSISDARVFVGGLFGGAVSCAAVEAAVVGKAVSSSTTLQAAVAALQGMAASIGVSPDGQNSAAYRLSLASAFLYKAFLTANASALPSDLISACAPFAAAEDRPTSTGAQTFSVNDPTSAPIGQFVPKLSAYVQVRERDLVNPSTSFVLMLWLYCMLHDESSSILWSSRIP